MKFNQQKYLYYAEVAFYIIYISCLVIITAVPIITSGAAITAGYKAFLNLKDNDNSMLIKDITKCYFKAFIKKMPYTLILTIWFISIIVMAYKLPTLLRLNFVSLSILYLICFELILFFQIIFIIYAQQDDINYFDLIVKAFYTIHLNLKYVILMIILQAALFGIVYWFSWTIIICIGFYLYLNTEIYSNKIKTV